MYSGKTWAEIEPTINWVQVPWEDIKRLYPNQWVILKDPKRDENRQLVSGVFFCAGKTNKDLRQYLPEDGSRGNTAWTHTGRDVN